jgi:hypothetical protein
MDDFDKNQALNINYLHEINVSFGLYCKKGLWGYILGLFLPPNENPALEISDTRGDSLSTVVFRAG